VEWPPPSRGGGLSPIRCATLKAALAAPPFAKAQRQGIRGPMGFSFDVNLFKPARLVSSARKRPVRASSSKRWQLRNADPRSDLPWSCVSVGQQGSGDAVQPQPRPTMSSCPQHGALARHRPRAGEVWSGRSDASWTASGIEVALDPQSPRTPKGSSTPGLKRAPGLARSLSAWHRNAGPWLEQAWRPSSGAADRGTGQATLAAAFRRY